MWLMILGWLRSPIVQWILVILGALVGYQAWKYTQQNIGARKEKERQQQAAQKAREAMENAKVPRSESEVEERLENGRF